jgi:hypothetical protein
VFALCGFGFGISFLLKPQYLHRICYFVGLLVYDKLTRQLSSCNLLLE